MLINQIGLRRQDIETDRSDIKENLNLSYEEGIFTRFDGQVSIGDHIDQRYRDHDELNAVVREYRREIEELASVIGAPTSSPIL